MIVYWICFGNWCVLLVLWGFCRTFPNLKKKPQYVPENANNKLTAVNNSVCGNIWWGYFHYRNSQKSKHQDCCLTHWDRVTHICVSKLTIIGSDNGLAPGRRQAIIWTNAGMLLIGPLGTNFSEILIGIQAFSFTKIHLKMSSAIWRPFYLGLNVLSDFLRSMDAIYCSLLLSHGRYSPRSSQ